MSSMLDLGTLYATLQANSAPLDREVDAVPGKLKKMGDKASAVAKAAGAAIATAMAASFVADLDVDAGVDKLGAQLGLTAQEAGKAGALASQLYRDNFGADLPQVNEAVRAVVQNIGTDLNSADFKGITGQVLTLADTFDSDLGGTTAAVGQLMKTGLAVDAQSALDIVARGFQTGADKGGDFLDTLNEYGTQFRKLGLDGQTATGLISQGLQAGARDSDVVADSLKEFSIRAIDGSKTTGEAFAALGLDAGAMAAAIAAGGPGASAALDQVLDGLRGVQDPTEQAALATGLFGTQAEDLGAALYALDPSQAAAGARDFAGAAQGVVDTVGSNSQATIEGYRRKLLGLGKDAIESSGPLAAVAAAAAAFGPAAIGILAPIGSLVAARAAQTAATAAATAAEGANTGATSAGIVSRAAHAVVTGTVAAATATYTAVQWLLNAAMSANPFVAVALVLGALVAGIIIAYKNSETFRTIVQGAFKAVGDAASFMWEGVLKPTFRFLVEAWLNVASAILDGAARAFGWVPGIGGKLKAAAEEFSRFKDGVNAALDGVRDKTVHVTAIGAVQMLGNGAGAVTVGASGGRNLRADGGIIPGIGGPRQDNVMGIDAASGRQTAWVSPGEYVVNAASYQKHAALVEAINADRLANGGLVMKAVADAGPLASGIGGFYEQALTAVTKRGQEAADVALRAALVQSASMGGGSGVAGQGSDAIKAFVRSTDALPYVWGAVGPRAYDCSGLVGEVMNRMIGRRSFSRAFTTSSIAAGQFGLKSGLGGTLNIGVTPGSGHMAGSYGGLGFEARSTKTGIFTGPAAKSPASFARKFHLANGGLVEQLAEAFDVAGDPGNLTLDNRPAEQRLPWGVFDGGGWVEPDAVAVNRSGRPERVLSGQQTEAFERLVAVLEQGTPGPQAGGQLTGNLYLDSGEFMGKVHGVIDARDRGNALSLRAGG